MPNLSPTNPKYEKRVSVFFIKKGMFICRLDRPWIDTPFWLQGFTVRTDEELEALYKYCHSVYIDIIRGIEAEFYMEEDLELPSTAYLEKQVRKKHHPFRYKSRVNLNTELPIARQALEQAIEEYTRLADDLKAGEPFQIETIYSLISPLIDSLIRNADALILLSKLQSYQSEAPLNSIDSCITAISFGRHMGLPLKDLRNLAAGALLYDIGKIKIPGGIWSKPSTLTHQEFALAYTHVEQSLKFLRQDEDCDEDIINMVLTHHERRDGSGYPNGLKGERIPIFGRVAGIIDCYTAMCAIRPYKESKPFYAALQEIYNHRESFFQTELVEKFLQSQGIYPNGSLIEFKSGEVGLVLSQNARSRLKPVVLILLDAQKKPYSRLKAIDLSSKQSQQSRQMAILRDLPHNSYGINLLTIYQKIDRVLENFEIEIPLQNPHTRPGQKLYMLAYDTFSWLKSLFSRKKPRPEAATQ